MIHHCHIIVELNQGYIKSGKSGQKPTAFVQMHGESLQDGQTFEIPPEDA